MATRNNQSHNNHNSPSSNNFGLLMACGSLRAKSVLCLLLVFPLLMWQSEAAIEQVHLSLSGKADEMVVSWMMRGGFQGNPSVQVGHMDSGFDSIFEGIARGPVGNGEYKAYYAILKNLQPDIEYKYQVVTRSSGGKVFEEGATFDFTTYQAKSSPDRESILALVGDVGIDYTAPFTTTSLLENSLYHLLIILGDLCYADGRQSTWDQYFNSMEPKIGHVPLMTCPGNHEGKDEHVAWEDEAMTAYRTRMPMEIPAKNSNSDSPFWYSFDFEGVHVLSISSEHPFAPGTPQYQWISKDLDFAHSRRASKPDDYPWIIVIQHRSFYSSFVAQDAMHAGNHGTYLAMRQALEPLFFKAQVDMVFSGHDHFYERSLPSFDGQLSASGIPYFLVGSGGHNLQNSWLPKPSTTAVLEKWTGYGMLRISSDKLVFEFAVVDTLGCPSGSSNCFQGALNNKKGPLAYTIQDSYTVKRRDLTSQSALTPSPSSSPTFKSTATPSLMLKSQELLQEIEELEEEINDLETNTKKELHDDALEKELLASEEQDFKTLLERPKRTRSL